LVDHGGDSWPTFPADSPARRIDALLVRDATVLHHGDPGVAPALLAAASDHRPVLAVLSLPGAAAAATGQ
jgi:endonuclease/exonuclease/phosphatase family metal-dependent hydrolase